MQWLSPLPHTACFWLTTYPPYNMATLSIFIARGLRQPLHRAGSPHSTHHQIVHYATAVAPYSTLAPSHRSNWKSGDHRRLRYRVGS